MEEYLDIWDANGKPTGKSCLKDIAHEKGLFHPTVHIWFYTNQYQVLMQQRGANKQTFPSFWDVSVAGHVSANETIEKGALREVKEEIGLDVTFEQLQLIDVRKNINVFDNGIRDCEFQHVFLCELKVPITDLKIQIEEVDAIRLFTFPEIKESITNPPSIYKVVPADYSYYHFVMDKISQLIKDY